jgi:hypothetical protein
VHGGGETRGWKKAIPDRDAPAITSSGDGRFPVRFRWSGGGGNSAPARHYGSIERENGAFRFASVFKNA